MVTFLGLSAKHGERAHDRVRISLHFEPFRGEPGIGWEAPRSHVPRISFKSIGMTLGWFVRAGPFPAFDATASVLAPKVCFQKPP